MVLKMGVRLPYLQITGDYMSKLGLSSQILQNTRRYTGKPICVTSFSGIPIDAFLAMRCGKNQTLFDFLPARQITRAGSACMEMIESTWI